MSCGCNDKYEKDVERIRKLARLSATDEQKVFVVFQRFDGSYGFCAEGEVFNGSLIEYVYP